MSNLTQQTFAITSNNTDSLTELIKLYTDSVGIDLNTTLNNSRTVDSFMDSAALKAVASHLSQIFSKDGEPGFAAQLVDIRATLEKWGKNQEFIEGNAPARIRLYGRFVSDFSHQVKGILGNPAPYPATAASIAENCLAEGVFPAFPNV